MPPMGRVADAWTVNRAALARPAYTWRVYAAFRRGQAAHWPSNHVAEHPGRLRVGQKSMALSSKGGAALQSPTATFRETEGLSSPSSRRHTMPVIVCECKVGIEASVKAKMASEFTSAI